MPGSHVTSWGHMAIMARPVSCKITKGIMPL